MYQLSRKVAATCIVQASFGFVLVCDISTKEPFYSHSSLRILRNAVRSPSQPTMHFHPAAYIDVAILRTRREEFVFTTKERLTTGIRPVGPGYKGKFCAYQIKFGRRLWSNPFQGVGGGQTMQGFMFANVMNVHGFAIFISDVFFELVQIWLHNSKHTTIIRAGAGNEEIWHMPYLYY
ncbi:hypothetical protein IW261DRAFT_1429016 [Armillaria novae-zelandiae]|uniref:Uncharacterized protein n=1 Tax=Armillaria novae-zelandiae TaxID=153914 RepID=A0AA39N7D4_9AGAR|nr:hypothetical protein IW261DRAFT_1429016 [Armillaria novae-zelandiae]